MKQYYCYILASKKYGTLYVGITNDLLRRVWEHKDGKADSFTKKYKVNKLVYFDCSLDVRAAIHREKCIKKWNRQWKINLIEEDNPNWEDLYQTICPL